MLTKEMEQLLLGFDDPDLTLSQREQLNQLVQTHPEAREYLRQLQWLDQQMETLSDDLDPIDFRGFAQAVNQKIDAAPSRRRTRKIPWRLLAPLSAAAAVVMVALPWFSHPVPTTFPPTQPTRPVVAKVVLTQPQTMASAAVAQVVLSYTQPMVQKTSIVKVVLASRQTVASANLIAQQGEIICCAGPVSRRHSIKQTATHHNSNNYFVF